MRQLLWNKQKGLCKWCGFYVPENEATLDHIVALSHGGGNGSDNLCMACEPCNLKRGNKCTAEELRS
ncbi:HNH endonuclease [Gimesia alba]|uniref:HNH endonuclease n=1 Tax=Gimesia alba TaxID=2527973 RepID=UPI0011AAD528